MPVFSFTINETGEVIDGDIIINKEIIGPTTKGHIFMPHLNSIPENFTFRGNYKEALFNFVYDFPKDYEDYQILPFVVFQRDLNYFYTYYILNKSLSQSDKFLQTNKLHWTHMPLVYKFEEPKCRHEKTQIIKSAFEEIRLETNNSVSFAEGENPDISIRCHQTTSEYDTYEKKVAGDAVFYNVSNIIVNATLNFYSIETSCGYFPFNELHEILHVFGYGHSDEISSIMYETTDVCQVRYQSKDIYGEIKIDDNIVEELKEIYSG